MKRAWLSLVSLLILSGSNRLDTLLYAPQQTGADWLNSQPFVALEINLPPLFGPQSLFIC